MNSKKTWAVVAVVVIVVVAIWIAKGKKSNNNSANSNQSSTNTVNNTDQSTGTTPTSTQTPTNMVLGKLEVSDNLNKGNLMVVNSTEKIYLHTQRDFSSLLNHQVSASINGDLSNFSLIDIKAQ